MGLPELNRLLTSNQDMNRYFQTLYNQLLTEENLDEAITIARNEVRKLFIQYINLPNNTPPESTTQDKIHMSYLSAILKAAKYSRAPKLLKPLQAKGSYSSRLNKQR